MSNASFTATLTHIVFPYRIKVLELFSVSCIRQNTFHMVIYDCHLSSKYLLVKSQQ